MRTPEFAAAWSEAQVVWEPQSPWLVSEEGGVSWKRVPSACEAVLSPSGLCQDCITLQSIRSRSCGPGVGQATGQTMDLQWSQRKTRGSPVVLPLGAQVQSPSSVRMLQVQSGYQA